MEKFSLEVRLALPTSERCPRVSSEVATEPSPRRTASVLLVCLDFDHGFSKTVLSLASSSMAWP